MNTNPNANEWQKRILAVGFQLSALGSRLPEPNTCSHIFVAVFFLNSFMFRCIIFVPLFRYLFNVCTELFPAMYSNEKWCNNMANNDGETFSNLNSKLFLVYLAFCFFSFVIFVFHFLAAHKCKSAGRPVGALIPSLYSI